MRLLPGWGQQQGALVVMHPARQQLLWKQSCNFHF